WNEETYFYVHNLQGDVIGLLDRTGALVVRYTYDTWGKPLTVEGTLAETLGQKNPYRYRGYTYDKETGLYYLGSRYYNPEIGRFINADGTDIMLEHLDDSILVTNLYAYCLNNPVRYNDPYGEFATEAGVLTYVSYTASAGSLNFWNPVGWVLLGAAVVGVCSLVGVKIYNSQKIKQTAALSSTLLLMNFASTAATPPPPNKGGKGTQTSSKTLYNKSGKNGFRIDVENPGNRAGQIHLQKGGVKYYYNVAEKSFRIGSSNGQLASKAIQQLLQNPDVIKAIGKGLTILGY
ncbi:RHS repeat-associated core domain-containing protein, partial [Proteiniclasticum sp. BAD-10]